MSLSTEPISSRVSSFFFAAVLTTIPVGFGSGQMARAYLFDGLGFLGSVEFFSLGRVFLG